MGWEAQPKLPWNPRDYVLRGVFCPLADVQCALDRIAEDPLVEHVVMLCADQAAILRSLCMCSPKLDPGGEELVELLQNASVHRRPRIRKNALQDLVRPKVSRRSNPRFPDSLPEIIDLLARIAEGHEALAAAEMMRGGNWLPAMGSLAAGNARVETAIFIRVSPRSRKAVAPRAELVDDVVTCVNGTAQADIRRDTATMSQVRRRLQQAGPRDEFAKGATQLVAVAMDVSEARQGACYMSSPARGRLELVAWHPPHRGRSLPKYPKVVPLEAPSIAAAAVKRQRTIQAPPGIDQRGPLLSMLDESDTQGLVELAIPIPGPMASPDEPAIGVLTVAKPDVAGESGEVTAFGAYDLARLRNVALRIALLNATSRANVLVSAGQALSWRPPVEVDEAAAAGGDTSLPSDLDDARPGIERGLKTLADATNSHSATFRAALPFAQTTYEHGTALVRIASTTPELDPEATRIQTHEDGGYNWQAALSGKIQNCPQVTDDPHFRQHRPGSRSELSLPVRVEGRIVGVINLENTHEAGYESFEGFGSGFAFQLGLAIADARLDSHTVLQRHATEIVNRYHTLSGSIESLRKSSVVKDHPEADTLQEELLVLKRQADELRSGPQAEATPQLAPATETKLPELLDRAIDVAKVDVRNEGQVGEIDWGPYDASTATIITQILHTILENIKWHSTHSDANSRVRLARSTWGGREEDLVIFQNKPNTRIDESVTRNLYRAPHQAGLAKGSASVPRLGAFLAGRLTRSLNGEASAAVMPNGDLRTTLAIPSHATDRASWLLRSSTVPAT